MQEKNAKVPENSVLLSPNQVAERLGVHKRTVCKLLRNNTLPHVEIIPGAIRSYRVFESDLNDFVADRYQKKKEIVQPVREKSLIRCHRISIKELNKQLERDGKNGNERKER